MRTSVFTLATTDRTPIAAVAVLQKEASRVEKPKADKKITERGQAKVGGINVPGLSKPSGTPGWLSKPANAAARKAK